MMDGKMMKAAQGQINVLIDQQKGLLEDLRNEEGLLRSREEDGKERVLDKERVTEIIEVLDGEADKLARFEITLAVAGTMKAGKSTAVNAIIGTEALPNRARPMTALPTVIRHEPNRREPCLTVNNADALDRVAREISKKLQDDDCVKEVRKAHDVDMKVLIDDLAAGRPPPVGGRHEGRDQVFAALGRINDLLRLGRHEAVGVELPMEEFDELNEMPSLTVHFRCLSDAVPTSGSLALLDLPGFNEARMSGHLTAVLKEQLEKASAILVILDYTQLNTVASGELEMLIDTVSIMMEDRIFVMVNKFDQHRANDAFSNEEALRKHISVDTMRGHVSLEHVYPVSAQRAYLASRALEALDREGTLPSPEKEPWVADFADAAFGFFAGTRRADPEEIRNAATAMWADSKFDAPLREVVLAAARRAAVLALQAALAKLKEYNETIENHLNLSVGSLTGHVQELESTIDTMNDNIRKIDASREVHAAMITRTMEEIEKGIDSKLTESEHLIQEDLDALLKKALDEMEKRENIREGKQEKRNVSLMDFLILKFFQPATTSRRLKDKLLRENFLKEGRLRYDDKGEYDEARADIQALCKTVTGQVLGDVISSTEKL